MMARLEVVVFFLGALYNLATCHRYGIRSETLHVPSVSEEERLGKGFRSLVVSDADEGGVLSRRRRQASAPQISPGLTHLFALNDTHFQLIIHWAGEYSDVVVALSKDIKPNNASNSSIYISTNYGITFKDRQLEDDMKINKSIPAVFDKFYNSPVYNSHYVFADIVHNVTFTTKDYGVTMKQNNLPFSPRQISMHSINSDYIVGYDDQDPQKRLYLSENFGYTWRVLQVNVKSFFWGKAPWDEPNTLFVEREEYGGTSVVVMSTTFFETNPVTLIRGVDDFQLKDGYLFATKNVGSSANKSLELWVSHNRSSFRRAEFPNGHIHKDYYVADASEDQVFLCVNHHNETTHLYISELQGVEFSLSLENVVYFNPKGANKDSWLRYFVDESFADIHPVAGLRGIFIASKQQNGTGLSSFNQSSYITFNKGASWWLLTAPSKDSLGNDTNCHVWSWRADDSAMKRCSLHLSQKYHLVNPTTHSIPILSKKSAIGLIMGTGNTGKYINKSTSDVYLSTDGGWLWKEVLKGPHFYTFGDHGGIIVAVKQDEMTAELLYSYDEGESWHAHTFAQNKMRVYGVITEPGETTTVFNIFGSLTTKHSWVIVQVNLSSVLQKPCTDDDYKDWAPTDNERVDCLLGRTVTYQRRRAHSLCYNGRAFERAVSKKNCSCTVQDYECDMGFKREHMWASHCTRDQSAAMQGIPRPCNGYYYRTKGYRRVSGNTCEGGESYRFEPDKVACPVQSKEDFILYTTRNSIRKYKFGTNDEEILPISGLVNTVSVEYDYKRDCVYWADAHIAKIQKLCLDGSSTVEDVVSERLDLIESLAYDWTTESLYWVDAHNKRIEVAKTSGAHRKSLINSTLEKPRSLILHPQRGMMYWTDWSLTNPRIMRSNMDGTNVSVVINGTSKLHWPNGLALDEQFERLYWTDAFLDSISTCKTDGSEYKVLIHSSSDLPHPYAIRVYKDEIYWTDWSKHAIMMADKNTGSGITTVKSNLPSVLDLKLFNPSSQQGGNNLCASNSSCTSLCLLYNESNSVARSCRCGDDYTAVVLTGPHTETCECSPGEKKDPSGAGGCVVDKVGSNCTAGQFTCDNGKCVSSTWRCDGDNDCGDLSDESDCPYRTCNPEQFQCDNMRCVPKRWVCDHDDDCGDGSDENPEHCVYDTCSPAQFECDNGRCIPQRWFCDGDNDCHDGSDESADHNCNETTPAAGNCSAGMFQCNNGRCIVSTWQCDGDNDCEDFSDEADCNSTVSTNSTGSCSESWHYRCSDGRCIYRAWICDGDKDCSEGEDEMNCGDFSPTPTSPANASCAEWLTFRCANGHCISLMATCDGINDCGDLSDEADCPDHSHCSASQFECQNGACINATMRCNGRRDCKDNSDEINCGTTTSSPSSKTCRFDQFQCMTGMCIYGAWVCDGDRDCSDGSDELHCQNVTTRCRPGEFKCEHTSGCVPHNWACDGDSDCADGSDEWNCHRTTIPPKSSVVVPTTAPGRICRHYEFSCGDGTCVYIGDRCNGRYDCASGADEDGCRGKANFSLTDLEFIGVTSTSLNISWRITPTPGPSDQVLVNVSYGYEDSTTWMSKAVKTPTAYLTGLQSGRTIYVKCTPIINGKPGISSPVKRQATIMGMPGKPENVKVTIITDAFSSATGFNISWSAPSVNYQGIHKYFVYMKDLTQYPHVEIEKTYIVRDMKLKQFSYRYFTLEKNHKYLVTVSAVRNSLEGVRSESKSLVFKVDCVQIVTISTEEHSVTIEPSYTGNIADLTAFIVTVTNDDILTDTSKVFGTEQSQFKMTELSPGTSFVVTLVGKTKTGLTPSCESRQITTKGSPIGKPTDISSSVLVNEASVKLKWKKPTMTVRPKQSIMYRIYYDTSLEILNDPARIKIDAKNVSISAGDTENVEATITNLLSCEEYIFMIQVTSPFPGPLAQIRQGIGADENAAPKKVEVKVTNIQDEFASVVVTWEPPCLEDVEPLPYLINVIGADGIHNGFKHPAERSSKMSHTINHLNRGARYNISVQVDAPTARHSDYNVVTVAPYPHPTGFQIEADTNDYPPIYYFQWDKPTGLKTPDSDIRYELYHYEGDITTEKNPVYTYFTTVNKTHYFTNNLDAGVDHSFKVRIESIAQYPGEFSAPVAVFAQSASKSGHTGPASQADSSNRTVLVSVLVPVAVVVIGLVTVLAVYIVRHRRLQNSFLSFANSHYDTRSGTTTFSSSDDLGEEEEPMIRGFSDDEPLVIA